MFANTARQRTAETGIVLVAAALVCAAAGALHMATFSGAYGALCGAAQAGVLHCAACVAGGLLAAAGILTLGFAMVWPEVSRPVSR